MSGWDEGAVFYSDQAQFPQGDPAAADITCHSALRKFKEFLRGFTGFTGPTGDFPYRESLVHNRDHVTVAIEDLDAFDAELANRIRKAPADYLPLTAGSEVLASLRSKVAGETGEMEEPVTGDVQIFLSSKENCVSMRSIGQWYVLSKTLAEEAAWKFANDNGLEIITINPTMVIGPLLQPTLNTSAEAILKFINGSSSTYPNFCFGWINVKDVALAHILAYEVPSVNGRYCMVERVIHHSDLVKIIHEMYPEFPVPDKCADDAPFATTYQVSKDKIRSLGMELVPLETSLKETIESLREKGFVTSL